MVIADDFEILVGLARRMGSIDRVRWHGDHPSSPEDMFDDDQFRMLDLVDTLCGMAVRRMVLKCEALGYEPSDREKNLLMFEYLGPLYLENLLARIDDEIGEFDDGRGSSRTADVIRELL